MAGPLRIAPLEALGALFAIAEDRIEDLRQQTAPLNRKPSTACEQTPGLWPLPFRWFLAAKCSHSMMPQHGRVAEPNSPRWAIP